MHFFPKISNFVVASLHAHHRANPLNPSTREIKGTRARMVCKTQINARKPVSLESIGNGCSEHGRRRAHGIEIRSAEKHLAGGWARDGASHSLSTSTKAFAVCRQESWRGENMAMEAIAPLKDSHGATALPGFKRASMPPVNLIVLAPQMSSRPLLALSG